MQFRSLAGNANVGRALLEFGRRGRGALGIMGF